MSNPEIFISSSAKGSHLARELGLQLASTGAVTLWSESLQAGRTAFESLSEVADRTDFAVFVITSDDVSHGRFSSSNAIFELGFFAGKLGMSRTFVVVADPTNVALPSDLTGIMYIALTATDREDLPIAVAPAARAIQRAIAEMDVKREPVREFYSCFISYAWRDQDFAVRLHDDLQEVGVRCWLDLKEMRAGDRLDDQITKAIQEHDKVLLVLSEHSIKSPWVGQEIRHALQLESRRQKTVLYPLSLDEAALRASHRPELELLRQKLIVDFNQWHDQAQYRTAFKKLVRDLTISASVESERAF